MELIFNNLEVVWFILITVLFAGFFLLEGFDYGTGILLPFIGKTDVERRQMINALGPVWDGNEVWMITAGGALFASFPHVYATLFSGFYLALFLMLAALIIRGVSFEFRSKSPNLLWRKTFDYCIFFGSLIPALLWGVTVGNLIQGTPIDASMTYVGTFFDLLSPYTVLCGIAFILVFTYHGGLFTSIKTAGAVSEKSRIIFVDDGSKDKTWELIEKYHSENPRIGGVKLAHNRGHQFAVLAGLMTVKDLCDMAITMDADLQDDIDVVDKFVEKYKEGCEVVYGVRNSRATDTFFKKTTAEGFYKIMQAMGVDIVFNHADYRLMSKTVLDALSEYKEVNLFLRGIVPLIGYKSDTVEYARKERFAGESKYPLKKMLAFAIDGITSFSIKPIRLITTLGVGALCASALMIIWFIIGAVRGNTVSGWATIVISIWLFGGLILLGLGVVGEYIGKIYMEAKGRPRFRVEKFLG